MQALEENDPQAVEWTRLQRLLFRGAMALIVGLLIWHFHGTMVRAYRSSVEEGFYGIDSTSFLKSAKALAQGDSPLIHGIRYPWVYPVTLAWLMIPLAYMPYWLAQTLWFAINVAAGAIAIGIALKEAQRFKLIRLDGWAWLGLALTFAITYEIPQSHLRNGQPNMLLVLCCMLAYRWCGREQPVKAAAGLGLGIGMKYFSMILMPYFFLRKHWGICLNAILFAILFASIPALWMGETFYEYYAHYFEHTLGPMLKSSHSDRPIYFSLYRAVGYFYPGALHLQWVKFACLGIILAPLTIWDWWHVKGELRENSPRDLYACCLWLVAFLLVGPLAQDHYLVFLMPGLALAVTRILQTRRIDEVILLMLYLPLHFMGHEMGKYPVYFASILLLYILLFVQVGRVRR